MDAGRVVNPDTLAAQVQGGLIFGITAALYGNITVKDGRIEQGNFNDYRMLRINEAPMIDVHIIKSSEAPGGIGEPGCTAGPPSLVNAIAAATGVRIRQLPIDLDAAGRAERYYHAAPQRLAETPSRRHDFDRRHHRRRACLSIPAPLSLRSDRQSSFATSWPAS